MTVNGNEQFDDMISSLDDYIEYYEQSHSQMMDVAFLKKIRHFILAQQDRIADLEADVDELTESLNYFYEGTDL